MREERLTLKDGSVVLVRPLEASDAPLLVAGFARLSEGSRYKRFLGPKQRLSPAEVAFLTDIDHRDHEAIGALDAETGEGVGVARYIRLPDEPEVAEAAIAVVDAWQGRGLGHALLDRLCERATANGVRRFTATLFASNRAMLALFEDQGNLHLRRMGSTVEVDVDLPLERPAAMHEAMRRAAAGVLAAWLDLGAAAITGGLARRPRARADRSAARARQA